MPPDFNDVLDLIDHLLEPVAIRSARNVSKMTAIEMVALSQALSQKRIADALERIATALEPQIISVSGLGSGTGDVTTKNGGGGGAGNGGGLTRAGTAKDILPGAGGGHTG